MQRVIDVRDVSRRRTLLEREGLTPAELDAVLEEVHFRRKGREKFPRARQMRFSREGLAQASSKWVAEYRTWKIRQRIGAVGRVLETCSGIGGDTIALATRWSVLAVERDPETAEILRHNLGVYGIAERVELIEGDFVQLLDDAEFRSNAQGVDCIFFDPSRRPGGKRRIDTDDYEPPLSLVSELRKISPNVCVKISPMVALDTLPEDCDVEVVSYKGAVKETLLWFGRLRAEHGGRVLATKLPERITWTRSSDTRPAATVAPAEYLYEPDPAFAKAGLVNELAKRFDLAPLDRRIAYLTSRSRVDSPLLRRYRVCDTVALEVGTIRRRLLELGMGRVDTKARGIDVNLKQMQQQIRARGPHRGLVIFTRVGGQARAILCRYDSRF